MAKTESKNKDNCKKEIKYKKIQITENEISFEEVGYLGIAVNRVVFDNKTKKVTVFCIEFLLTEAEYTNWNFIAQRMQINKNEKEIIEIFLAGQDCSHVKCKSYKDEGKWKILRNVEYSPSGTLDAWTMTHEKVIVKENNDLEFYDNKVSVFGVAFDYFDVTMNNDPSSGFLMLWINKSYHNTTLSFPYYVLMNKTCDATITPSIGLNKNFLSVYVRQLRTDMFYGITVDFGRITDKKKSYNFFVLNLKQQRVEDNCPFDFGIFIAQPFRHGQLWFFEASGDRKTGLGGHVIYKTKSGVRYGFEAAYDYSEHAFGRTKVKYYPIVDYRHTYSENKYFVLNTSVFVRPKFSITEFHKNNSYELNPEQHLARITILGSSRGYRHGPFYGYTSLGAFAMTKYCFANAKNNDFLPAGFVIQTIQATFVTKNGVAITPYVKGKFVKRMRNIVHFNNNWNDYTPIKHYDPTGNSAVACGAECSVGNFVFDIGGQMQDQDNKNVHKLDKFAIASLGWVKNEFLVMNTICYGSKVFCLNSFRYKKKRFDTGIDSTLDYNKGNFNEWKVAFVFNTKFNSRISLKLKLQLEPAKYWANNNVFVKNPKLWIKGKKDVLKKVSLEMQFINRNWILKFGVAYIDDWAAAKGTKTYGVTFSLMMNGFDKFYSLYQEMNKVHFDSILDLNT